MKKVLTFTNFIALCGIISILLFFTPCFTLTPKTIQTTPLHYLNLFNVTFGCSVSNFDPSMGNIAIYACGGLIAAFIFLIVGVLLSIAKNRIKLIGYLASAFYIAAGVLIACGVPMITASNYEAIGKYTTSFNVGYYGWAIAIATIVCFIGVMAFIDTVVSTAKPKVQEVY